VNTYYKYVLFEFIYHLISSNIITEYLHKVKNFIYYLISDRA